MKLSLISMLNPFGVSPKQETLEDNAKRFVRAVLLEATDERYVTMYREHLRSPSAAHRGGWVCMANEKWRDKVIELLADAPLRNVEFTEPDSFGNWSLFAMSMVHVPRIQQLELDQTL